MLVKDLIKKLEEFDKDLEVFTKDSNGDDLKISSISIKEIYKGFQEKKVIKLC